jgi:hypothetical protein
VAKWDGPYRSSAGCKFTDKPGKNTDFSGSRQFEYSPGGRDRAKTAQNAAQWPDLRQIVTEM